MNITLYVLVNYINNWEEGINHDQKESTMNLQSIKSVMKSFINTFPVDKTTKFYTHSLSRYVTCHVLKSFFRKKLFWFLWYFQLLYFSSIICSLCVVLCPTYSWIWKGVSAAVQCGRWTCSCPEIGCIVYNYYKSYCNRIIILIKLWYLESVTGLEINFLEQWPSRPSAPKK